MASEADEAEAERVGPRQGDAFGAMLLACHETGATPGTVFELVERDDGYLDPMDTTFYFAPPERWGALDHWACARALERGGRALDVGAGAGRHTLYLQERGLEAVALDVSVLAGDVCRRRGVRQVFTGSVFDLARAEPHPSHPFDTFLLMGNNLGLLGGAAQAPRFLAALAALARPDARLIGAGIDPYRTTNALHLAYHARNRALGRLGGQIRMRIRHKDLATDWFDYLFATTDEPRGLLQGTPWRLEHVEPQRPEGSGYVAELRLVG
jgi:SAM-dependent methyltransferase